MTNQSIKLCHLCLTGPKKKAASIEFGEGLNVIYGASETGKSFLLETIDFMLGASGELRDIPERVGFDRIFLGIEFSNDGPFTLERSTSGGDFRCYEGLYSEVPEDVNPDVLKAKHAAGRENTVSAFLLKKIGLWDKRIRRNAGGDTNSLSFRNLAHLTLIDEKDIQKRESPVLTGQYTSKTTEMSVFKLLLSGVDDSSIQPETKDERLVASRAAKIEIIDELIADYNSQLEDMIGDDNQEEIENQLERLENTLSHRSINLQQTEDDYQKLLGNRNEVRKSISTIEERRSEIGDMLARFSLLDEHYQSDISRLEGVQEAGSLISALDPGNCPLCGADTTKQHLDSECDGDLDSVVVAAEAEKKKIESLRKELEETVNSLKLEMSRHDDIHPELTASLKKLEKDIKGISPDISEKRAAYSEVLEKKNSVQQALSLFNSIQDLEGKRSLMDEAPKQKVSANVAVSDLSSSTLDEFSILMEEILKSWNFPDSNRVHFDRETCDLIISGKPRGSRGKGMRAITHAAFSVGIMKYAEDSELCHPGFVVLDTPLLAYREPEGEEDDLRGTDVHEKFYECLSNWKSRQVIILENQDPPKTVKNSKQSKFFSKNPDKGRYGFLPKV